MSQELCWLSAVELVEGYRARRFSPVEVVDSVLAQIDRLDADGKQLVAVVTRCDEAARVAARQAEAFQASRDTLPPLFGVPITVKDLHATAGLRTTFGSKLFETYVPAVDALVVARLKAAGAIVVGKTNTSEFGILPLAMNGLFGESKNPWNAAHNTGGSSGGAAAGVVCGMGPLATASDGGGSIRIPASFCGAFGLKPHMGRIAHVSIPRGWENLSHQGPISRTVRDAARFLDCTAGPDDADRRSLSDAPREWETACGQPIAGLRLAWTRDWGGLPVEAEIVEICQRAAARFTELGATVDEVALDLPDLAAAQQTIVLCEAAAAMPERRAEWEQCIFYPTRKMLPNAERLTYRDLLEAHWARDEAARRLAPLFARYDALLSPTSPVLPTLNGTLGPKEIAGHAVRSLSWLGFVVPANMTGQPAASLPVGWSAAGLPVGLQIVGRRFDEATVLRLASAYESAFLQPFRRPPIAGE